MEIEFKLALDEKDAHRFLSHDLFQGEFTAGHLFSVYYDTPNTLLRDHGFALRLRQQEESLIQALKSKGTVENGLHKRDEWEWEVKRPEINYAVLTDKLGSVYPKVKNKLQRIFTTEFVRYAWWLESNSSVIEVALDHGIVKSFGHTDVISEVELELKSGKEAAIIELAQTLKQDLPVKSANKSKAMRGYHLYEKAKRVRT